MKRIFLHCLGWVAWYGGKGNWSAYDKGDSHPNYFMKVKTHHDRFETMLEELEKTKTNYDFGITD